MDTVIIITILVFLSANSNSYISSRFLLIDFSPFYWLYFTIFFFACMVNLMDARHLEYYFVGALYSCRSSWALFWMLGNNLILLCLAFKIC